MLEKQETSNKSMLNLILGWANFKTAQKWCQIYICLMRIKVRVKFLPYTDLC